MLFLLYLVAVLDRTNIGFAALTMNADLRITGAQYGLLTGIFFWGYCLFEVPSNLLMRKIDARTWIARILLSWGIVAVLSGFVRNSTQLYAARFLLGIAEAGYAPGILLYLTFWFRRREQAQMIGLFLTAIPVANILGSPLSGWILDHVHWLSLASWRWLLVLEGLPAILGGAAAYLLLPSRPADAAFLTAPEKDWIIAALATEECQKSNKKQLSAGQALANGRVWHLAFISFAFQTGGYAVVYWMPRAVKSLADYSNTVVGLLVMIPYVAGLIAMILVSRSSDRKMERRYHAAMPLVVGGVALLLLGGTHSLRLSFPLWCFAVVATAFQGPFFSLPNDFLAGSGAAAGIALINCIGSLGGFVGPSIVGVAASGAGGIYRRWRNTDF
ncbi:MAG: MFS transporter [Acidobacteriia bacterium]|nr:MFS transporter [Terriglobia bacterium]